MAAEAGVVDAGPVDVGPVGTGAQARTAGPGAAPEESPAVLVVDDEDEVRALICRILRADGYRCEAAANPTEARKRLAGTVWDLVLCDVRMGRETGMGLLGHIRTHHPDLPVVMVSGVSDLTTAKIATELGAYGYVTKPFNEQQVVIAADNALRRARLEAENARYRSQLEAMVRERSAELVATVERLSESERRLRASSEETVGALARAIEGRDVETGHHIERMSRYAGLLAGWYGLGDERAEMVRLASPMHDIGKIAVPDGILFKPGRLTGAEHDVIRQHPELGYQILSTSVEPLLRMAATIARTHHERWDGNGYPHGLAGEAIPIEGRIASVADVFDALMSRRVYKPAFPLERSLEILSAGRGSQFDPAVVDLLVENVGEVAEIQARFPDG